MTDAFRTVEFYFDPPPSINSMFGQAPGHKRFPLPIYKDWNYITMLHLNTLHIEPFNCPVFLQITYPDIGRFDLNNRDKGILDILKKAGIIKDDSRKWVRRIILDWGNIEKVRVIITVARSYTITYSEGDK
jgi:Holliday junction resolvase RusA-like endonuclease